MMQNNHTELKDDMAGLRDHAVSRDQELAAKFDHLDDDMKQLSDEANARHIARGARREP